MRRDDSSECTRVDCDRWQDQLLGSDNMSIVIPHASEMILSYYVLIVNTAITEKPIPARAAAGYRSILGARGWRVVELADRIRVHEPAEPQELAEVLSPIELALGWTGGEEQPPQLATAEKVAEFRCCYIYQEQDDDPQRNGGKPVPREGGDQIRKGLRSMIEKCTKRSSRRTRNTTTQ